MRSAEEHFKDELFAKPKKGAVGVGLEPFTMLILRKLEAGTYSWVVTEK